MALSGAAVRKLAQEGDCQARPAWPIRKTAGRPLRGTKMRFDVITKQSHTRTIPEGVNGPTQATTSTFIAVWFLYTDSQDPDLIRT